MNTKLGILALFVGAGMVLVTVGVGTGCSSSTSGTGSTTTTSTTTTKATTGTGTGTTSSTATGGGQDCTTFCAETAANCAGALNPFTSTAECMTKCATIPVGKPSDTTGNTLGCRIYHEGPMGAGMNPTVHCPHGGIPAPAGSPCTDPTTTASSTAAGG